MKYNVSDPANNTPAARWIGLERSFGNGVAPNTSTKYCIGSGDYGPSSAGKRKYFTTDLTYGTLNKSLTDATKGELLYSDSDGAVKAGFSKDGGQTVIVPVHNNPVHGNVASSILGECVWLYVDECDEEAEASTVPGAVRSATIRVTYGSVDDGTFKPDSEDSYDDYVINQHLLFKIDKDQNNNPIGPYYIEYEEEYLYNFDAEDDFNNNQTFDNGMTWGLEGAQLSFDHKAMYASSEGEISASVTTIVNNLVQERSPYYDFYLTDDVRPAQADVHSLAGYDFTKEIINDINNTSRNTNTSYTIGALELDKKPRCAIEYCYNRNKRNASGQVVETNWYMPAIDELQEIVSSNAYSEFEEFQGYFYWSCQPAYTPRYLYYEPQGLSFGIGQRHGSFAIDNVDYARATRTVYKNSEYTYDASGATGYYDVFHIINDWWFSDNISTKSTKTPFTHSYMGNSWTAPAMSMQPGYKLRTDNCRVRAVRKMN